MRENICTYYKWWQIKIIKKTFFCLERVQKTEGKVGNEKRSVIEMLPHLIKDFTTLHNPTSDNNNSSFEHQLLLLMWLVSKWFVEWRVCHVARWLIRALNSILAYHPVFRYSIFNPFIDISSLWFMNLIRKKDIQIVEFVP